jgi:hypothetical protein
MAVEFNIDAAEAKQLGFTRGSCLQAKLLLFLLCCSCMKTVFRLTKPMFKRVSARFAPPKLKAS